MKTQLYYYIYSTLLWISNRWDNKQINRMKLAVGSLFICSGGTVYAQNRVPVQQLSPKDSTKVVVEELPPVMVDSIPTVAQEVEEEIMCFVVTEYMPEYPGGVWGLNKYIKENLQYPLAAKESGISGRVVLQFVINEKGMPEDIKVIRSPHISLEQEAIRLVKGMPRWKPGYQGGKPVKVNYTLPITFSL